MIRFFRKSLFLSFSLIFTSLGFAQNVGTLSGYVKDAKTGEGLIGATVQLEGTGLGSATDLDGYYEISKIPTKTYNVITSYIGYESKTEFNVVVKSVGNVALNFNLTEANKSLNEVVVVASSIEDIITPLSTQTLSAVEIATYPGGNNDIAKVVQSLPGVGGSVLGFRNDVIIRGGAPNENVYYLDGVEIPNINHFSTQGSAGGPVGLLNVSFIENVDLATSAFNAKYDNPLSGVLQFNQRIGNTRKFQGNLRVSASETAFTGEGPLFKNGAEDAKTSYIVSVRRSYLQFLFKLIGLPILPDYWDYQYKLTHQIDQYNEINFLGIGAIDDFRVDVPNEYDALQQSTLEQVPIIKQWSTTAGLSWKRRFKDGSGFMRTTLSNNILDNNYSQYSDNVAETGLYFENDSRETETKLRYEQTRYINDWILTGGFGIQQVSYENRTTNLIDDINYRSEIDFLKYGLFFQASRSLFQNRLDISFGLRADGNSFTSEENQLLKTVSPRFSFSYALDPAKKWRFNGSIGRYFKIPPYTILGFRNNQGENINQDAKYISSNHFVLGLERNLSNATRITLEGFFKKYDNYPLSVLDRISLANKGGDFEVLGNEAIESRGEGRTYGVEFMFQQKFTKNFYGILAYTFFKSEFSDFDGVYRPSVWDARHLASFTGGYKFGNNWEVSLRYRYSGRTPYPLTDEEATLENYPAVILNYDNLGDFRLSSFNQADIRIDKKWNFKKLAFNLYLEVQNAFAQTPPEPPVYGLDRDETGQIINPLELVVVPPSDPSVLPIIGFVLDF